MQLTRWCFCPLQEIQQAEIGQSRSDLLAESLKSHATDSSETVLHGISGWKQHSEACVKGKSVYMKCNKVDVSYISTWHLSHRYTMKDGNDLCDFTSHHGTKSDWWFFKLKEFNSKAKYTNWKEESRARMRQTISDS